MGVEWNKCFICLEEVHKLKGTRRGRRRTEGGDGDGNGVKLLVEYIMLQVGRKKGGEETNERLVGSILEVVMNRNDGGGCCFLCDKCEEVSNSISKLHLELEVVQMKIINLVETVREQVLKCLETSSSVLNGDVRVGRRRGSRDLNHKEEMKDSEKRFVEIIHSFQKAVKECGSPQQVPYVLLERSFGVPSTSPNSVQTKIKYEPAHHRSPPAQNEIVKTEPQDFEVGGMDDFDTHSFTESMEFPSPLPPKVDLENDTKRIRKRRIPVKKTRKTKKAKSKTKSKKTPPPRPISETKPKKPRRTYRDKNKYSCDTCQSFQPTLCFHHFHHHLQKHETGEKRFHCDTCPNDLWLSGQQLYDLHQDCHHRKMHLAQCDYCYERIDTFFLKDHMMTCSKGPSHHPRKIFSCPNCTFAASTREKLLRHLQEHDISAKFLCDLCSEECPTRFKLLEHLVQVHKVLEEIKCPYPDCKKSFLDRLRLAVHEKLHARKFVCRYCDKAQMSPANLRSHERIHTGERPIICPECGEGLISKLSLQRHLINQHGAPKFKCEVCEKEYRDQQLLKQHMRLHRGDLLPCEKCGAKFVSKGGLQRHLETHSTQLIYTCEQCGKSFPTKISLGTHIRTHSTERPFKCEYCEKAFRLKSFLVEHLRTHTGERPFVCDTCGASFTQHHCLVSHKMKHS